VEYFTNIFKAQCETSIAEILQISQLFPSFVEQEDNKDLMAEVSKGELLEVVHSFQKDKSLGPDGWPIEFYLVLYDITDGDLLKVVEESISEGIIHASLNSNFITLIPKVENPTLINDFRPIFLCNYLYKIISKVIT
jgi:hypothetical protein